MRPFRTIALTVAGMLGVTLLAPPAVAGPAEPASPSLSGLAAQTRHLPGGDISNEELGRVLDRIARASKGRVSLRTAGYSNEGRPIRVASLGHGPTRLLYVTQQHGDEPLGTPAAVRLLWALGVADSGWHRWLRSRVTLDIVVRANPDGHVRNWRYNYDPDADPEYGQRGQGYDINRYHDPGVAPRDNPVPEAAAIQQLWIDTRPRVVVDYHMQGRYAFPDGREITASILWPTNPAVSGAAVRAGKQLAVANYDSLTYLLGAVVSQYPGGDYEGIARNAYGLRGSASLLVELSDLGPRYEEFQIATALLSMLTTTQRAADGSLWRLDPARADAIPPRGPAIPSEPAAHADHAAAA